MTNHNVAVGYQALYSNTTGSKNTALGYQALCGTSTGSQNTALGYQALYKRPEPEPLTEWYKAAVKAKGLTPHTKEKDGSET
jgi:hypothetical protein